MELRKRRKLCAAALSLATSMTFCHSASAGGVMLADWDDHDSKLAARFAARIIIASLIAGLIALVKALFRKKPRPATQSTSVAMSASETEPGVSNGGQSPPPLPGAAVPLDYAGPGGKPVAAAPPAATAADSTAWHYSRGGVKQGPVHLAVLQTLIATGQLNAQDLVSCDGAANWIEIGLVPALHPGGASPAAPPALPPPPLVRPAPSWPAPGQVSPAAVVGASYQGMGTAAFVFSLLLWPVGFILSLVALNGMSKSGNRGGKGLATAGLVVSSLLLALSCIGVAMRLANGGSPPWPSAGGSSPPSSDPSAGSSDSGMPPSFSNPSAGSPLSGSPPSFNAPKFITNSLGMKFVRIEPGTFQMGSPTSEEGRDGDETQHSVTLTRPYYMGIHHVTRGDFRKFIEGDPYKTEAERAGEENTWMHNKYFEQSDAHPVVEVTWNDAIAFIDWLNRTGDRATGHRYRLPTEAEWEYACRAGTTTPFNTGATISTDQANYNGNFPYGAGVKGLYRERTTAVGTFPPNKWGLYDMHGNAWQWCSDVYGDYPAGPVMDPTGPEQEPNASRLRRGGSWDGFAVICRSALRVRYAPVIRDDDLGCRVVLDSP